jgi:hypothetical protein
MVRIRVLGVDVDFSADGKPAFCFADGCVKQAVTQNYEIYNQRIYFQLRQVFRIQLLCIL